MVLEPNGVARIFVAFEQVIETDCGVTFYQWDWFSASLEAGSVHYRDALSTTHHESGSHSGENSAVERNDAAGLCGDSTL